MSDIHRREFLYMVLDAPNQKGNDMAAGTDNKRVELIEMGESETPMPCLCVTGDQIHFCRHRNRCDQTVEPRGAKSEPMRPTYYVRHPDGTYSKAEPQP